MATGSVKWFDEKKGYGFIEGQGGHDIFVHFSDIQEEGFRKLAEGEKVKYELLDGQKGPRATNVMREKLGEEVKEVVN
jgi:CspA family cold shock protein